jgi:hypothetical protein
VGISRKIIQGSFRFVEEFTLNSQQSIDQEVFLENIPTSPELVVFDIPSGTVQIKGFDFDVDGNRIYWSGLALETVLEQGDNILIIYS